MSGAGHSCVNDDHPRTVARRERPRRCSARRPASWLNASSTKNELSVISKGRLESVRLQRSRGHSARTRCSPAQARTERRDTSTSSFDAARAPIVIGRHPWPAPTRCRRPGRARRPIASPGLRLFCSTKRRNDAVLIDDAHHRDRHVQRAGEEGVQLALLEMCRRHSGIGSPCGSTFGTAEHLVHPFDQAFATRRARAVSASSCTSSHVRPMTWTRKSSIKRWRRMTMPASRSPARVSRTPAYGA